MKPVITKNRFVKDMFYIEYKDQEVCVFASREDLISMKEDIDNIVG